MKQMERLGRYDLLEYVAEDPPWRLFRARRRVAGGPYRAREGDVLFRLLTSVPGDAAGRARLAQARLAVELRHPHIERVLEWEHDEPHCVTELVQGWRLHHLIDRDQPFGLAAACMIGRQLCGALQYLHEHPASDDSARGAGVVHRAVRPHTVLITTAGAAQLKNPGLVMVREREPSLLSMSGPAVYERLSPEQTVGSALDQRSDIFQLGLLLDELITARPQFSRGAPFDTVAAIREEPAVAPSQLRRDVPAELDAIIGRALAKSPDDRHQTAGALEAELAAVVAAHGWPDGRQELFLQLHKKRVRSRPRVGGFF